jgi:hypothetical protein
MAAVKILKLDIFCKINVEQTVWIRDNSSDCKESKTSTIFPHSVSGFCTSHN